MAVAERTETRRLQREWYARLRADGFDDIEYGREDGPLKVACRENRGIDALDYESTVEYFSRAAEFLHRWQWPDERMRDVWRRHTDGETLRTIGKAHGCRECWAHGLVSMLRETMGEWWRATAAQRARENTGDAILDRLRAEVRACRRRRIVAKVGGLQLSFAFG